MKESSKVFISYTKNDLTKAEILANELVNLGIDVWFDKWEIKGGDNIIRSIEKGIQKCCFFIVLLSKNIIKSKWVNHEIDMALSKLLTKHQRHIKILPIILDDIKIPQSLSNYHAIRFGRSRKKFLEQLLPTLFPEYSFNPSPKIQEHTREQFLHKVVTVLGLKPVKLRTTLVGPLFFHSESMIKMKHELDGEKRSSSATKAIRSYLMTLSKVKNCDVYFVIKITPRYHDWIKKLNQNFDVRSEIKRIICEIPIFMKIEYNPNIKYLVTDDFQYSNLITDRIVLEANRYSATSKLDGGWSSTQRSIINQKTKMFDTAFQKIYTNNLEAQSKLIDFFNQFI